MNTASMILLLAIVMTVGSQFSLAADQDPDSHIREKLDIEPNTKNLRAYLSLIAGEDSLTAEATELFEELGDDAFTVRQAALAKLDAMPQIPEAALKAALASHQPEIVMQAKKLASAQTDSALASEITVFACLRTVSTHKLVGLVPELLAIASKCGPDPTQKALLAAMATTATTEEDEALLRAAIENPELKSVAEEFFQWQKSGQHEPPATPGWDSFFDAKLMNGKGEGGHKTEFVKGVPTPLLECFKTSTRSARTISSVSDRRKNSPWLYPEAKWGEIPKVLEEKGHHLYPIWGTWKQHWSRSTIRLNENGSLIDCEHSGENNIHMSSSIQFLIVPSTGPDGPEVPH